MYYFSIIFKRKKTKKIAILCRLVNLALINANLCCLKFSNCFKLQLNISSEWRALKNDIWSKLLLYQSALIIVPIFSKATIHIFDMISYVIFRL